MSDVAFGNLCLATCGHARVVVLLVGLLRSLWVADLALKVLAGKLAVMGLYFSISQRAEPGLDGFIHLDDARRAIALHGTEKTRACRCRCQASPGLLRVLQAGFRLALPEA